MQTFEYNGPFSAETIEKVDYNFTKGQSYDLPESNDRVKTLLNIGYLKPIIQEKTKKQTQAKS